jgi:glycine C-acetyltransferase
MINLCANNYLGLASHPDVIAAAHAGLERYGYGMASVRFICGTQSVHSELEQRLSAYLGMEDTILYSSCFDANGGLFETLLDDKDAVISDALNHASIIDGIRLCKAKRLRYANNDLNELETALKESQNPGSLIATDGVFSMDGSIARLGEICDLADRYDALVMVDDSHATGFIGARGRGSHEYRGVMDRVDILTGTFGKALGRRQRRLRRRSAGNRRVAASALPPLSVFQQHPAAGGGRHLEGAGPAGEFARAAATPARQRTALPHAHGRLGFQIIAGRAPHHSHHAGRGAAWPLSWRNALQDDGVYVVAFAFPVVPHGKARIRTQMNAAHTTAQLDKVIQAFGRAGRDLGIIQR